MRRVVLTVVSLCLFLIFYEIVSIKIDRSLILPRLELLLDYLVNLNVKTIGIHITHTLVKTVYGYTLSILVALFLAVLTCYKPFTQSIQILVSILRSMPTISIIIILIIWFGTDRSVYIIGFLVVFPLLYTLFYHTIKQIDPQLAEVALVYRFTWWEKVKILYAYPLIETFFLSLKQTFGLAFKVMIMAEVIGQLKSGIGSRIINAKINIEMEGIFIWTILLILTVLVLEQLIEVLKNRIIKWR